jgi:hypothetical protein
VAGLSATERKFCQQVIKERPKREIKDKNYQNGAVEIPAGSSCLSLSVVARFLMLMEKARNFSWREKFPFINCRKNETSLNVFFLFTISFKYTAFMELNTQ